MANTYTQIYLHYVFAVQNRLSLINSNWETDLYKYMNGIISKHGHFLYVINGMPDHVHALVSMNPRQAPSELMQEIKRSSTLWINENRLVAGRFSWQEGFGAFSYGKSQVHDISTYIENQKIHHKKRNFIQEYIQFLKLYEINYDDRYIYKPIE